MATVNQLGFNIFSRYNGKGVAAAKRDLDTLARKRANISVKVSTAKAREEIDSLSKKVSALGRKSASIRVNASTAKARADLDKLSAKVTAIGKRSASLRIKINTDNATASLNRLMAKLETLRDVHIRVRLDFTDFVVLQRMIANLRAGTIHIPVRIDQEPVRRFTGGIHRAGVEGERAGNRTSRSFLRSTRVLSQFAHGFDVMHGQFLAWVRIALVAGPAVAGGIGAASVAVLQAATAFGAAAGGAGVFALAMKNVAAQAGGPVANSIARAKKAVNSFGTGSAHILGQVATHAVNAFINALHMVEPAVRPVSKVFLSITKDLEKFTKSPAAKAFTGWFKVAAPAAITSLWGTFKVFAEGLYHFLARIGAFNGSVFLDWLNRAANAFNRWAQGEGPIKLKRFFDQWGPKLVECAASLLRLAHAMGKSMNPVVLVLVGWLTKFSNWLAKLIDQHPVLGQVIAGVIVAWRLLNITVAITNNLYGLMTARLVRNSAAWIYNKVQVLASKAAQAGRWLLNAAEFLSIQTVNLVRNSAAWIYNKVQVLASKAVSIASTIMAAVRALVVQSAALIRNAVLWTAQKVALIASRAIMIAIRVATLAWAAAQWLLNAALAANPIGLIVIAIAALVVGLVIAYKKSETFRNIVNGAWNVVKAGALALWNVLKIVFHGLVSGFSNAGGWATKFKNWIIGAFNAIRGGVVNIWGGMWGHVRSAFNAAWAAIRGTFNVMRGWIVGAFNAIRGSSGSIWSGMWAHIRGAFSVAWGAIRGTFNVMRGWIVGAFNAIRGGAGSIWAGMWNRIRGAFNAAWGAIRGTFNVMRSWIIGAFNAIRGGAGSIWAGMWNHIRGAFSVAWGAIRGTMSVMGQWIANKFHSIHNSIGGWWSKAWNWIRGTFNSAWGRIRGSMSVMGQWMGNKFHAIRNSIGSWWNKAWTWIRNIFNFAWGKIRGSIGIMGQWLGNKFHAIRNSIGSWWNKAWTWIRNIFNFAWGKIRGSIGVMGKWLGNKFHAIRNSIGSWWNKAWTWIRNIFNFAWGKVRASIGLMGQWLGNKFHAIRNSIGSWWNKAWTWIRNIFNFAWGKLHGSMGLMGQWMGNKFHAIHDSLSSWWNKLWGKIRSIFNWAWGKIRGSMHVMAKTMSSIWHGIVNAAGTIFNGIKRAVGRPINTVIGFVQTLAKLADKALGLVGVKSGLFNAIKGWKVTGYNQGGIVGKDKPTMGFAMGGLMPGYSPGRDNLVAPSPIGPVGLSGGEGILRPEVMRAPGMTDFLYKANRKARSGGIAGVTNMLSSWGGPSKGEDTFKAYRLGPEWQSPNGGFAKGGVVANFDDGGVFGKIFGGIKKAVSVASHFVPGIGSLDTIFKGGKKIFETTGFDMIVQKVLGKAMDKAIGATSKLGAFGQVTAGFGRKVIDGIVNYVVGKTTPQTTDGDPFYKNPSKRLKHALSWAKSQAGKPYQWGGGGNPSYDCSGFMASIQRVINGKGPGRLYTTHNFHGKTAPSGWKQDAASPFMVGVTNAGVGHMAGTLINNHVESAGGGKGVNVGPKARGAFDKLFKWHYGYMPVAKEATLVSGGNGRGGPMAGTIGKSGEAFVGTFWDTGHSGYGDTGAPASGKKMHKFALASRNLIPYGKTAIMQAFGKKRMAAFESIDYGPGITSRLFDIDTYGAAWLFGKEKAWSASNPGRDVSPGVFRVHWKKGYGQGGSMPGNQLSLVGERGPEVMVPNRGQRVFKSGSDVSVGDTHVHFHDKVYVKSEKEFQKMVVTAISEAKRKKKI